jgi:threonylcarbamoyladenosine tRNA methylthiotransferase MtaB
VGFPGETDGEFAETLELIESIPFSNMHVFQYSTRSGTPAATMDNQIPATVKKTRSDILLNVAKRKKADFSNALVGKSCAVLIEKIDSTGKSSGWTQEYLRAEITNQSPKRNEIVEFVPARAVDGMLFDN